MIERVARAIVDADYQHREPMHVARAAIAAMREPDLIMTPDSYRHGHDVVWRAMIDAALEEK